MVRTLQTGEKGPDRAAVAYDEDRRIARMNGSELLERLPLPFENGLSMFPAVRTVIDGEQVCSRLRRTDLEELIHGHAVETSEIAFPEPTLLDERVSMPRDDGRGAFHCSTLGRAIDRRKLNVVKLRRAAERFCSSVLVERVVGGSLHYLQAIPIRLKMPHEYHVHGGLLMKKNGRYGHPVGTRGHGQPEQQCRPLRILPDSLTMKDIRS